MRGGRGLAAGGDCELGRGLRTEGCARGLCQGEEFYIKCTLRQRLYTDLFDILGWSLQQLDTGDNIDHMSTNIFTFCYLLFCY